MSEQFLDFVLGYLPGYALVVVAILLPTLVIIVVWRTIDHVLNKVSDRVVYAHQAKRRYRRTGEYTSREDLLNALRALDPTEFEYYVATIFVNAGFQTKVVGAPGEADGGVDIVMKKDNVRYFVQCKKFIGKDINVALVRDFYGAVADELYLDDKSRGYFITTTRFTDAAKRFAKKRRLVLYDGDDLMDIIFRQESRGDRVDIGSSDRSFVLRNIPPICPVCRRSLVWRKGGQSSFIGCTGYPQCHYVFNGGTRR